MPDYYEAYDVRYRQVHQAGLSWASNVPTPVVTDAADRFGIDKTDMLLEVGCGEGRDAFFLLEQGYRLLATDVSGEAVSWCRKCKPSFAGQFQKLDCLKDKLPGRFRFIYAVAVLHMLVQDRDRRRFYGFFREHLADDGIGLICTMGDGVAECASDISQAFALQERTHQETGMRMQLAATSCRMVSMETFQRELAENGLKVLEVGITEAPPDFFQLLYAVVRK